MRGVAVMAVLPNVSTHASPGRADFTHAARISTLGELATSIAHEVKQPLARGA